MSVPSCLWLCPRIAAAPWCSSPSSPQTQPGSSGRPWALFNDTHMHHKEHLIHFHTPPKHALFHSFILKSGLHNVVTWIFPNSWHDCPRSDILIFQQCKQSSLIFIFIYLFLWQYFSEPEFIGYKLESRSPILYVHTNTCHFCRPYYSRQQCLKHFLIGFGISHVIPFDSQWWTADLAVSSSCVCWAGKFCLV